MHLAAKKNDTELLKMICEKGVPASLKKLVTPTVTPFMIAAKHGCKESLEYLHREARVDIKMKDNEGLGAVHYAAMGGNLESFIYLIKEAKLSYKDCSNINGNNILHLACKHGNLPIVRYCCETLKLDPHQYNYEGVSTLRFAVENNKLHTAIYLVSVWNVSMFLPDDKGISPIAYAASYEGTFRIFQYFAEVAPSEALIEGDLLLSRSVEDPPLTPLKAAIKFKNRKVVELIHSKTQVRRKSYVLWIFRNSEILAKLDGDIIRNVINFT
jgi:ankyrin repeat protein